MSRAGFLHLIWDLDGTLINSEGEVYEALVRSVREAGLSEKDQKAAFRVGPTVDRMLDAAFNSDVLSLQKKREVISRFRGNYDNCGFERTLPFEGIDGILSNARFVHHIVTNKPDLATGRILEKLGWKSYFASVITPYSFMKNETDEKKSKAELFRICMEQDPSVPSSCFFGIGDMEGDEKAAHSAGVKALGVLWGTGTREELSSCDRIFDSVGELKGYLLKVL